MRKSNGTSDYIRRAQALPTTAWTVSMFYRNDTAAASATTFAYPFYWGAGPGGAFFIWGHTNAAARGQWAQYNGTSYLSAKYTTTLAANTLYHVCGVWDGSTLRAYLNGAQEATASVSAIADTGTIYLGLYDDVGNLGAARDDGEVGEFAVWRDTFLSADQVKALAKGYSPLQVKRTGLIDYWPLVRDIYDQLGNTLTVSGTTVTPHVVPQVRIKPRFQWKAGAPGSTFRPSMALMGVGV